MRLSKSLFTKLKNWWSRREALLRLGLSPDLNPHKMFEKKMTEAGNPELETVLRQILDAIPTDRRLRRELAVAYAVHGSWEEINSRDAGEAIRLYGEAVSVDGNNPEWRMARANNLVVLAERTKTSDSLFLDSLHKRAIEDYSMALRCDPTSVKALAGRARILSKMGRTDDAKRDYEDALNILARALEADRRDSDSLITRTGVLELLGRRGEALDELKNGLALANSEKSKKSIINRIAELEHTSN